MNNEWLPKEYKLPEPGSGYMRLEQGDNKFRVMSSPVIGNEFWIDEGDKRKPVRRKMNENIETSELGADDKIKHFWAFVVWNYQTDGVAILELTQKSIMKAITNLTKDEDWGSPVGDEGYDIVINRTGEKMDTEYSVIAKPKKKLAPEILEAFEKTNINLGALFSGDDPFTTSATEVNIDDFNEFEKSLKA